MNGPVLVTGGSGLVGSAVLRRLEEMGVPSQGVVRRHDKGCSPRHTPGPSLSGGANWLPLLGGCEVVIHTAGRVHIMDDPAGDPLAAFRETNVAGTLALARQAAESGVRRFLFISSVKANGEATLPGKPFRAEDPLAPCDPYGVSKAEAENELITLSAQTGMELVIIRPPLIYGLGVKANFLTMMRWLRLGLPLPFGALRDNRRSLIALDNLVDLTVTCIHHPAAANQVFLASDGEDLSTAELLRRLARAMGVSVMLFPVPPLVITACATALGKRSLAQRLCGNLQVDISKAWQLLGWQPVVSVDEGLRRTAAGFPV